MVAGFLGIIAFGLVLFIIGALMESNVAKAAKFGAALACCLAVIFVATKPKPFGHETNCYVDWDGRSNSTVCD